MRKLPLTTNRVILRPVNWIQHQDAFKIRPNYLVCIPFFGCFTFLSMQNIQIFLRSAGKLDITPGSFQNTSKFLYVYSLFWMFYASVNAEHPIFPSSGRYIGYNTRKLSKYVQISLRSFPSLDVLTADQKKTSPQMKHLRGIKTQCSYP